MSDDLNLDRVREWHAQWLGEFSRKGLPIDQPTKDIGLLLDHVVMLSDQCRRLKRYLGSIEEALEPDNKDGSVTQAWVMRARNYARTALRT